MNDAAKILRLAAAELGVPLGMAPARAWYDHPTKGRRFGTFSRRPSKWNDDSRALIAKRGNVTTLRKSEKAGVKLVPIKGDPSKYLHSSARGRP